MKDVNLETQIIEHASFVSRWDSTLVVAIDPVGVYKSYEIYGKPDLILITDIHSDHMDTATLSQLVADKTLLIVPQAVMDMLPKGLQTKAIVLANGEKTKKMGLKILGMPMYNLRPEALKFHTKGRGNGYVLEMKNYKVYISGDTEDIPEMRALKGIDLAYICMNLPYTMTVQQAASAVLDFKPKTVVPYHYRGTEGLSDLNEFKSLVNSGNSDITVELYNWYPNNK